MITFKGGQLLNFLNYTLFWRNIRLKYVFETNFDRQETPWEKWLQQTITKIFNFLLHFRKYFRLKSFRERTPFMSHTSTHLQFSILFGTPCRSYESLSKLGTLTVLIKIYIASRTRRMRGHILRAKWVISLCPRTIFEFSLCELQLCYDFKRNINFTIDHIFCDPCFWGVKPISVKTYILNT